MNAAIVLMLSVFPLQAQVLPITIIAGSPTDQYFLTVPATSTYTDAKLPAAYPTMRYGASVHYRIPLAAGVYAVMLTFVEPNKTAAGQRVMTVSVNGQVSQTFDVFKQVGDDVAFKHGFMAFVQTDVLDVLITGVTGSAIISQIDIAGVALEPAKP